MNANEQALSIARRAFQLARGGDAAGLAALLDAGMPVDARNENGDSLLMLAAYHGHLEAAELLLRRGADPELRNDRGQTPLAGAAFKGNEAMVALLLDRGAEVDGLTADGRTPLTFAAMFDHLSVVELLLARGASPHGQATGVRPLEASRTMGARRTESLLDAVLSHPV